MKIIFYLLLSLSLNLFAPTASLASGGQNNNPFGDLGNSFGFSSMENEFLDPDDAFRLTTRIEDNNSLIVAIKVADDYYLYRDKFKFKLISPPTIQLGEPIYPKGKIKNDEFFGRIETYTGTVEVRVPFTQTSPAQEITVEIQYQGCADAGICYPPITKTVQHPLEPVTTASVITIPTDMAMKSPLLSSEQDSIAQQIGQDNLLITLLSFFGFGLLLSFTPCVFPMIPILSSIIIGEGDKMTTRRAFILSLTYVLSISLTYTILGVIAGLFGENLQAAFQNPWIIGSFSLIFVALAMSMFGFYNLQLPASLQSRLNAISNNQRGGSLLGVAIMGFLSALIVGPCVAAPLAGALIYIGQTGDAILGGLALFSLSMGMGAPLLAIGTGAGKLLPKAGAWMDTIKSVFGVLLLALALWMLERILPVSIMMLLSAILLIITACYMRALDSLDSSQSGWARLWKGLGVVLLIQGIILLFGIAVGGHSLLQPLSGVFNSTQGVAGSAKEMVMFKRVKDIASLEHEVKLANEQGKAVMLDFYADWCISCKELEKFTFSDPGVQAQLSNMVLLQADVTENDATDKALLKKYGLIGPPSILFFNLHGDEQREYRLVGFLSAEQISEHLDRFQGQLK
ncbi:MAG: protein-disulfide reductase DsbD [Gammaproteobacteria bacterium]|nr:protein-disulfide reductase DsbD [Gammaproteobacteria bacterium]